jgi:hypothetical protein
VTAASVERSLAAFTPTGSFWPGAFLRLPGFDRQLTQHSRRSTARITAVFTPQIRGFRSPDSAAHFQDYLMAGV